MRDTTNSHRVVQTRVGTALAVLGGILALVSVVLFASQMSLSRQPTESGWWFYFASIAAWLAGAALWTRRRSETKPISGLLLPIIVLAALLRLAELDTLPYGIWYDEALNAVDTREILQEPSNRPISEHNTTFLHYALYALAMQATGLESITGVRLVQALFGVGSAVMAYLVGRRLRGETFGLLFAFTLAVMRWSINFSRIGMTGVEVTFFILLAFYALYRLVHSGHLRDALLAGAAVGFGLWFYRAFQLLLVPLLLYALLAWRWRAYGWRRTLAVIGVAAATLLLIAQPLGLTAILQPDLLFGRLDQTSIFAQDLGGRPLLDVMGESIVRHLRMFHFAGDRNGRHNLPDAPMLDPITGVLVVAGMVVALAAMLWAMARSRRTPGLNPVSRSNRQDNDWRAHAFFFLLAAFSLAAGVLSIPSEAPQGLRVIGVLPAVAYFAALAADALLQLVQRVITTGGGTPHLAAGVASIAAVALALPMFAYNYDVYFRQQRAHYATFISYSTPETLAARLLRAVPVDHELWVSPNIGLGVQASLLAAEQRARVRETELVGALPITQTPPTPITLLLDSDEAMTVNEIIRLYPDAEIQPINASDYGVIVGADEQDTLLYRVTLTPQDIAASQRLDDGRGLLARYYENETWSGEPVLERRELFVHRYVHVIPLTRPYTVEWIGSLYAPISGEYTFGLRAIQTAWLRIDDAPLLQTALPNEQVTAALYLEAGWHRIQLRHLDSENFSRIYLEWQPPDATALAAITSAFLRLP